MPTTPQLSGRAAIVTGSSRGIGFGIAAALARQGAGVMLNGIDPSRLSAARERLVALGREALGDGFDSARIASHAADVRDPEQVERLVEAAVAAFGRLDILVNNAGVGAFGDIATLTVEAWRRVIDINLNGVFYCCRAAIPHLRKAGEAWVINISSLAGKNYFPGGGVYCASKAALNAFSEILMQEVRYDGIRVSYIMPGSVHTEFEGPSQGGEGDWKVQADDVGELVLDLLAQHPRSLASRIELRPSKPRKR